MKKHFKLGIIFAVIVSLFLGTFGCANKTADGSKAESKLKEQEPVTINIIAHDNTYNRGLKQFVPEFEKATGIKVNLEIVGQQVHEQRTQLDFAGKTGSIDVAYMPFIFMQKWAKAGWIRPLDEFVKQDEKALNLNDFIPSTLEALKWDGKLWGLPCFAEAGLMAYRKDVFAKYGINEPPKTWEELLKVAAKIHSPEIAAIVMRGQRGQGLNMFIYPMFMWAYGGSYFKDYPKDMTPVLDREENVKALEIYTKLLREYSVPGAGNFSYPDVVAAIQSGKAAIAIDGTSIVGQFLDPKKNKFADQMGIAMVPGGPAGVSPCMSVHAFAISAFSKHPKEAWEFIKWATSSEVQRKVALSELERYPDYTRLSVANDPEVLKRYNIGNIATLRVEALKLARSDYRPLIPEWPEVGDVIGAQVSAAVNGITDPRTALKKANEGVMEIMKRAGYIK